MQTQTGSIIVKNDKIVATTYIEVGQEYFRHERKYFNNNIPKIFFKPASINGNNAFLVNIFNRLLKNQKHD